MIKSSGKQWDSSYTLYSSENNRTYLELIFTTSSTGHRLVLEMIIPTKGSKLIEFNNLVKEKKKGTFDFSHDYKVFNTLHTKNGRVWLEIVNGYVDIPHKAFRAVCDRLINNSVIC